MSYLCLSIRFLQPYYHGRTDGGTPEWPPAPLRLFQALVAAASQRALDLAAATAALQWLEEQPPPTLVAVPGTPAATPYRLYVPDNVADRVAKSWCGGREATIADYRTEKDVRPMHLHGEAVHYLFPLGEQGCPHAPVLTAIAQSITHLGWGVDMVAATAAVLSAEAAAQLPGERWQPGAATARGYRVPIRGTLAALRHKHQAFLTRLSPEGFRPVPPLTAFELAGYRRTTEGVAHAHAAFKLLHPLEERLAWFAATRANAVAAMTRHAAATAAAPQDRAWVDTCIHGHRTAADDAQPRFSYLPLPTIEHRGAAGPVLGGIRRVLVAELREAPESQLRWARQLLPGQGLCDEQTGARQALLAPLHAGDWVLRQYTAHADTWATVTPVVLPGSDDGRRAKAEKLFAKVLAHAGYAADAVRWDELELRNVSFWPGGELALHYRRPDYLRKGHWSVYHVWLRWQEKVSGPLALGAGRHCGLGVFAALPAAR